MLSHQHRHRKPAGNLDVAYSDFGVLCTAVLEECCMLCLIDCIYMCIQPVRYTAVSIAFHTLSALGDVDRNDKVTPVGIGQLTKLCMFFLWSSAARTVPPVLLCQTEVARSWSLFMQSGNA